MILLTRKTNIFYNHDDLGRKNFQIFIKLQFDWHDVYRCVMLKVVKVCKDLIFIVTNLHVKYNEYRQLKYLLNANLIFSLTDSFEIKLSIRINYRLLSEFFS